MRVLIIGASGQLGQALVYELQATHELLTPTHEQLDISTPASSEHIRALQPELVLLPAAYTDVDGCARDPERAYRENTLGPKYIALACAALDIPLVYVSTNEVFDGATAAYYREYDRPNPINAYGRSKWGGEQVVMQHMRRFYIVRVAWLFGGRRNFVRTVLRLADERPELKMVTNEIGSPTYTFDVAAAIARLIETECYGIYHLCNEGSCSRFEFAQTILRLAGRADYPLQPITLADYQRASTPPPYSPLQNIAAAMLGITLRPWEEALAEYISSLGSEAVA